MKSLKKLKMTAVILMVFSAFIFSGCGGNSSSGEGVKDAISNVKETPEAGEEKEPELDPDAVVLMTVGKSPVIREEALFYIYQLKSKYGDSLGSDLWNMDIGDGQKLGEYALEETKRQLIEIKIICQAAREQGITLLSEEEEEARQKAKEYMSKLSEQGRQDYNISLELVEKVYMDNMLASKMYDITTAEVTAEISDEDARCSDIQYIQVMSHGITKEGVSIEMTPEEEKAAKKRAEELLKTAKKTEDFKSFAQINTDAATVELTICRGEGPEEIEEAALSLHTGEFSAVVEGKEGYYIIYCVDDSNEDEIMKKKEELIIKAQDEKFMAEYTKWSEECQVVISATEWDNLKF